ncbi:MBL fold metallo-hydrolase [Thiohalomonas denitrificans]|uniref:MBL fold metallo-hydrolase n=1 Tax=Thiohalomonas denitrificans TaxID=415747 RepID=UPI0026EE60DA|nr:MBL fold metallo-hydrolase [Thiohalomonas denitrificans]
MDEPTFGKRETVADGVEILPSYLPVPGFGVLPVNAFLLRAAQPMLVDTGLAMLREGFLSALSSALDPKTLRWIWVTHTDADHVGNLAAVLEAAPEARVVTNYVGMAKMTMLGLPVVERVYLLNPGQSLNVGDRTIQAVRPPTYDAPETTALFDPVSRALFSADCFGALLSSPYEDSRQVPADELDEGLTTWATVDAPWLRVVDDRLHRQAVTSFLEHKPKTVLSSHLPPAPGMNDRLGELLNRAIDAPTFVGPDQAAMEQRLAR